MMLLLFGGKLKRFRLRKLGGMRPRRMLADFTVDTGSLFGENIPSEWG